MNRSPRFSRRIVSVAVAALAIAGTTVALFGRDAKPVEPAQTSTAGSSQAVDQGAALTVSIVQPVRVVWPEVVDASGAIAAWQEAAVNAETGGSRLVEVLADVGDKVHKGQLLARFDDAQSRTLLEEQKAALAEAEARYAEAEFNAKRARRLEQTRALSEQDSFNAITTERAAKAQLELARARLSNQQLALDNTRVVAPDAGVVSSRSAMLGVVGAPGMELFRLVRQNRFEWRAELTAASMATVDVGDKAQITLPDGQIATGVVRQLSPVLDASSRTGVVFVAIDDAHATDVRVGVFAGGTIVVGERAGLVLVASTIVLRDGYSYVFLVDRETGRVSQRKVTTGRRMGDRIELVEGVSVDDSIVESGGAFLSDGDRVRIVGRSEAGPYTLGGAS